MTRVLRAYISTQGNRKSARNMCVRRTTLEIIIGIFGASAGGLGRLTRPQHELHRDERRQNQADEWHGVTREWREQDEARGDRAERARLRYSGRS